ncbi:FlgO family outer membrane protein [Colwellia sp. TT2012]|uniref:FlgO family outer membrane protein n=1 Tax=Colwellia sp. TT2012 TaxID=1720342 RepID=UPI000709391C|nr:FlgO family outer membrane protein [Colwellia sp. TT2012]
MKPLNALKSTMLILTLTGCSSTFFDNSSRVCIGDNGIYQRCDADNQKRGEGHYMDKKETGLPQPLSFDHALLPDYVEQLAMNLKNNLQKAPPKGAIALTSFVPFDSTLQKRNELGNQLSELLYTEMHKLGFILADIKIRDYIEITPMGDFSLSREQDLFIGDIHYEYVLIGTLLKTNKGTIVNARIVSVKDKRVISSAKKMLPNFILVTSDPR